MHKHTYTYTNMYIDYDLKKQGSGRELIYHVVHFPVNVRIHTNIIFI